jgi:hypothetical protein
MSLRSTIFAAVVALASLVTQKAHADYFYYYTGTNYTWYTDFFTRSMKIFGIVRLSNVLPPNLQNYRVQPLTFSFGDGVNFYSSSNDLSIIYFAVSTDNSGNITSWDLFVQNINTCYTAETSNPSQGNGTDNTFDTVDVGCDGIIRLVALATSRGTWMGSSQNPTADHLRRRLERRKSTPSR